MTTTDEKLEALANGTGNAIRNIVGLPPTQPYSKLVDDQVLAALREAVALARAEERELYAPLVEAVRAWVNDGGGPSAGRRMLDALWVIEFRDSSATIAALRARGEGGE